MRQLSPRTWTLLAFAWALLAWWLLATGEVPGEAIVTPWVPVALQPWQDKLGHAALFLVQALLVERAAAARLGRRRAFVLAVVLCLAFGVVTELRQRSLPGRDADPADFAADAAGAVASALALPLSRRRGRGGAAA